MALLGDDVVNATWGGIKSGRKSRGLRTRGVEVEEIEVGELHSLGSVYHYYCC